MLVETRKALTAISDAIEVTKMLEELMTPGRESQLTTVLPGLRITLRDARERISQAHSTITSDIVAAAREKIAEMKQNRLSTQVQKVSPAAPEAASKLNAGVEKIIEP